MKNSAAFTDTNTPQTKLQILYISCVSVISPEEDSSQPLFPLNVEVRLYVVKIQSIIRFLLCNFPARGICTYLRFPGDTKEDEQLRKNAGLDPFSLLSP